MTAWRMILTNSESPTGVAPVCLQATAPESPHDRYYYYGLPDFDVHGVYDCCPGPHIECWNTSAARIVAEILTANDAEVCSWILTANDAEVCS